MTVLGVNKILNWCQIVSDSGRRYTCYTKVIDGALCFFFKKQWHKVGDYLNDYTDELVDLGGKIISRKYME